MAILSKDDLYDLYIRTELSGDESKAYELSWARKGNSGWSYGQPQWDLRTNTN